MRWSPRLTFKELSVANRERMPLFKNRLGQPAHSQPDGSDWSLSEWTNALAGEVGEACNFAKKLHRGDYGEKDSESYKEGIKLFLKELADVVTYADIAAQQVKGDLGEAVQEKFNEVSDRIGVNIKL